MIEDFNYRSYEGNIVKGILILELPRKYNLWLCGDHNMVIPIGFLLNHVLSLGSKKIEGITVIVDSEFPRGAESFFLDISKFNGFNNLTFRRFHTDNLPGYRYLTSAAWLRVLAMMDYDESLPVLYLDCDLLLLSGWEDIFESADQHATEIHAVKVRDNSEFEEKFPASKPYYFNSGVMILLRDKWRELTREYDLKNLMERASEMGFKTLDQDLLNYVIRNNYVRLSEVYNCVKPNIESPKIVHFAGASKPWGYFKFTKSFALHDYYDEFRSRFNFFIWLALRLSPLKTLKFLLIFNIHFTVMNLRNWRRYYRNSLHI